ncbi:MAG: Gfo/Idh/MocA family oxidoreductase [Planctomycetales bacterium]|nr:Gfo/Idh/MocA family oxidoreductase [Planctomycetales bacterium]
MSDQKKRVTRKVGSFETDRRKFLQAAAVGGAGVWIAGSVRPLRAESANEEIRFACIGVGGKGSSDSADAGKNGKVVAICDIDDERVAKAAERFPDAKQYNDYRKMLDEMEDSIDAVTVSTPDHSHAPAAVMAMRKGKHCFCQKPMTHSLYETRLMGQIAKEKGLTTQMGNQGTSTSGLRRGAATVKAGAIGDVHEVHIWTNRPIWPQGIAAPEPSPKPDNVHWDLWIGPAKYRPYAKGYHPFAWRGWWDFGTGALGDMACHTMNLPFAALDMRSPLSVQAVTSGHDHVSYPKNSTITYEFGPRGDLPPMTMTWYDGGNVPATELFEGEEISESGSLMIGTKGKLYSAGDYGEHWKLLGADEIDVDYVESPGHFTEFAEAIKSGGQSMSNFPNYATPLTETVLLGNLAVWADGEKVEWDAENLEAKGRPDLAPIIQHEYREGWTL